MDLLRSGDLPHSFTEVVCPVSRVLALPFSTRSLRVFRFTVPLSFMQSSPVHLLLCRFFPTPPIYVFPGLLVRHCSSFFHLVLPYFTLKAANPRGAWCMSLPTSILFSCFALGFRSCSSQSLFFCLSERSAPGFYLGKLLSQGKFLSCSPFSRCCFSSDSFHGEAPFLLFWAHFSLLVSFPKNDLHIHTAIRFFLECSMQLRTC